MKQAANGLLKVSNNEEELAHLLVRLSKNIDNLARVRNATLNDYITGLDEFIIDLNVYVRSEKSATVY